ncbi:uncharacterized protein PHALS_07945 [Plasmopara halstedii]|uniref:Uncharacterized protein n=1 Tax=Plasmopara halstedii TaxID=4781 RepID=A0A0P1B7V7_PLAHL|nr:uncharacterized protein PHALS_07945 [Plasmopara halstedii]CEG50221.1 hypothetical protein PHALS_07945 [Plasmopara halstedii]|eukprot:XP_024586590.1 hypothetical protein PHALS_07945 [Plasmopara halstedii]
MVYVIDQPGYACFNHTTDTLKTGFATALNEYCNGRLLEDLLTGLENSLRVQRIRVNEYDYDMSRCFCSLGQIFVMFELGHIAHDCHVQTPTIDADRQANARPQTVRCVEEQKGSVGARKK